MNATKTMIADGIYFLHPEGGSWIAARIRNGKMVAMTEECNAASHSAANDQWSDIVPSESDAEISNPEADAIVLLVLGKEHDPSMVVVTQPTEPSPCEHDWHYYGTVNGKADYGCQKCGATRE